MTLAFHETDYALLQNDPSGSAQHLDDFVNEVEAKLPPLLLPVVREHCQNLINLSQLLAADGHSPKDIEKYVCALVASNKTQLLKAIETEETP